MTEKKSHLQALEDANMQRKLSKEELLRPRLVTVEEYIDSLDGKVTLRSMSHGMREELRQKSGWGTPQFDEGKFTMLGIVYSVVDPELTEADVETLMKQDVRIIDELVGKISVLNMLGKVEELKKE